MRIAILGAGAFGTALAITLARDGRNVMLWGRDAQALAHMHSTRRSPRLPKAEIPAALRLSDDLGEAAQAGAILLATPMQSLSGLLKQIDAPLSNIPLVACCKGIDLATGIGPSGLIAAHKPHAIPVVLTGPSFATDIARGLPTALTLACADDAMGQSLQQQLSTTTLRLYRSADVIGAELGGGLKNVIAIACGGCIGIGMGDSARAALMTRGFAEITRLATRMGAEARTLSGLSGFGDLTLTCTSQMSRNYRFGLALGRGDAFDPDVTVEGVKTAAAVTALSDRLDVDMPICRMVHEIADGQSSISEAIQYLLNRPLKEE